MKLAKLPQRGGIYLHILYNGGVKQATLNLIANFRYRGLAVDLILDVLIYSP